MDLYKAIKQLYEEKRLLDEVIASLEALLELEKSRTNRSSVSTKKRRGRKSMSPEERQAVSERMKRYWEERRKQLAQKQGTSGPASENSGPSSE